MKKIVITLLTLSICFGAGKIEKQMKQIKQIIQTQYQDVSLEELSKFGDLSKTKQNRTHSRDFNDVVGAWDLEDIQAILMLRVGTDQSSPNPMQMMGLEEVQDSIEVEGPSFSTALTYALDPSIFGDLDQDFDNCAWLRIHDASCDGWNNEINWTIVDEDGQEIMSEWPNAYDDPNDCASEWDICLDNGQYTFYCVGAGDSSDLAIEWNLNFEDVGWSGQAGDSVTFTIEDSNYEDDEEIMGFLMNISLFDLFSLENEETNELEEPNPTIVAFGSSVGRADSIDIIFGVTFDDTTATEFMADSADAMNLFALDTNNYTIDISELGLSLWDSTGTDSLILSGSVSIEMIDFLAGALTSVPFPFFEFGEGPDDDFRLEFMSDSTGFETEWIYDDYEDTTWSDTSHFTWKATIDTHYNLIEEDEWGESDTIQIEYATNGDSLFAWESFDPCEEDGFDSLDQCLEDMFPFFSELEDVQEIAIYEEILFLRDATVSTDPTSLTVANAFKLYANYPNPFNPITTIQFDLGLDIASPTSLNIYDISGRLVATLVNKTLQAGDYEVKWNAQNFASGIYFSELISGNKRQTQKMILLK